VSKRVAYIKAFTTTGSAIPG